MMVWVHGWLTLLGDYCAAPFARADFMFFFPSYITWVFFSLSPYSPTLYKNQLGRACTFWRSSWQQSSIPPQPLSSVFLSLQLLRQGAVQILPASWDPNWSSREGGRKRRGLDIQRVLLAGCQAGNVVNREPTQSPPPFFSNKHISYIIGSVK